MEAPEKLYLHPTAKGKVGASWLKFQLTDEDIEYTRTDVIVKEVCEWLKTNYTEFLDSSRLGINIEDLVKDLKNDFKTE